jgi:hypothetical protein
MKGRGFGFSGFFRISDFDPRILPDSKLPHTSTAFPEVSCFRQMPLQRRHKADFNL